MYFHIAGIHPRVSQLRGTSRPRLEIMSILLHSITSTTCKVMTGKHIGPRQRSTQCRLGHVHLRLPVQCQQQEQARCSRVGSMTFVGARSPGARRNLISISRLHFRDSIAVQHRPLFAPLRGRRTQMPGRWQCLHQQATAPALRFDTDFGGGPEQE